MVDVRALTPFSTAARYAAAYEPWVATEYDQQRIAAYQVCEDIYWSQLNLVQTAASGDDPIQVPVARALVEAVTRYLAVDWDLYVDPRYGTAEDRVALDGALRRLFKREDFWAKFATQKRWGLVKGDALWHLTADPSKPAGTRISIHALDPATYFPIFDPTTDERVVGVHLAFQTTLGKDTVVQRQTYRRLVADDGTVTVTSEAAYYESDAWDDREGGLVKLVKVIDPVEPLPGITQLPVYRVPNTDVPGDPFGSSVFRGSERTLRGVDQTITEEDLAVSLGGLGVYWTNGRQPVDETGAPIPFDLSPLNVLKLGTDDKGNPATMGRLGQLASIEPSQQHAGYLEDKARAGMSVPTVALGSVDAQVAESGIALYLKLSPLLAANAEREQLMLGRIDQMLYDLVQEWLPEFEDLHYEDVVVTSSVGDPMPTDRSQKVSEVISLANPAVGSPIITVLEARTMLNKLGYQLDLDATDQILQQVQRTAQANDPFGGRLADEAQAADRDDSSYAPAPPTAVTTTTNPATVP